MPVGCVVVRFLVEQTAIELSLAAPQHSPEEKVRQRIVPSTNFNCKTFLHKFAACLVGFFVPENANVSNG